jgi:BASS family bile acid:Na+ symporter
MESSILTQIVLPLVLFVIMFGMGLSLTKDDFLRLWKMPKPVFVGLFGQLILLPIIVFCGQSL